MWPALTAAILLMAPPPDPVGPPPSRIVFASARTGVAQLYSMEPSGAGLAQLTFGLGNWSFPVPSPDGRFVAAFRAPELWRQDPGGITQGPPQELWLMRADGSGARFVSSYASDAHWSSDSRRLFFFSLGREAVVPAAGGKPKILPSVYGTSPTLSPDGRSIAFVQDRSVRVLRNGHERTVARGVDGRLVWSPNGRLIAIRDRARLAVVRAAGGVVKVFSAVPSSCVDCVAPGVAWSPDSRRLAFQTGDGIGLAALSPGAATLLVKGPTRGLAWSPRGDEITFATSTGIGVVTLDGHTGPSVSFGPAELQWGIGWSPRRARRYQPPDDGSLAQASGRALQARFPIWQISADGDRVAYRLCPHSFGVWRPGDEPVALGPGTVASCLLPTNDPWSDLGVYGLALAGDRLAYLTVTGVRSSRGLLWVTTLERGDEGVAIASGSWASSDYRFAQLADLVGGGSAIVYGQRGRPPESNLRHPESVWRVDGTTPVQVASRSDDLQPLALDRGRIVVGHRDGSLELLSLDGRVIETFDVPSLAAVLAGDDLVVLVQGGLRHYSVASGELVHAWPLPDVRSSGRCRTTRCYGTGLLTLDDAARGVVVYTFDGVVHLLRLGDGEDTTVPGATVAELTEVGLFYAFTGEAPWPGGIRFVPFDELPF
jgi:WD40-like Beta Propeller Repeat